MEEEKKKAVEESTAKTENEEDYELPDVSMPLEHPIEFEGKTYEKVDMNGIYDISLADLAEIQSQMNRKGIYADYERSIYFYAFVAAKANNMPYEWLLGMKARDAERLQMMVKAFLFTRV